MRDTNALRLARENEPDPYRRRFPFPKWNGTVTVLQKPRLFARLPEFDTWTRERHEQVAREYLNMAACYSATANRLADYFVGVYGTDSALIAGGFREHWPDAAKDAMRVHNYGASDFYDKSLAHWQASGKRLQTWKTVRHDVQMTWAVQFGVV